MGCAACYSPPASTSSVSSLSSIPGSMPSPALLLHGLRATSSSSFLGAGVASTLPFPSTDALLAAALMALLMFAVHG